MKKTKSYKPTKKERRAMLFPMLSDGADLLILSGLGKLKFGELAKRLIP